MALINQWKVWKLWLGLTLLTVSFWSIVLGQAPASAQGQADNEYQEGAILWTQTAGEMRLLIKHSRSQG